MKKEKMYMSCFFLLMLGLMFPEHSLARQLPGSNRMSEQLSPRNANYTMEVRLDVDKRLITGTEIITWRNPTSIPTQELRFHLYYNAWRNDKSSFFNSIRYQSSFDFSEYKEDEWAYCNVHSVQILGEYGFVETDVTTALEFIQPDDGNENDRTVLRLPLPQPVGAGETISLEIRWESKVPRTFARTGARNDYYFLAQWFPKVGVFEPDGTWNCHQFISTEFYADFGIYDVKLTVPADWIVGSTGKEMDRVENGDGTTTHHYYQEDVHDFTWTTSPHYSVYTKRFEEPDLPPVDMRLLLMPDHADKKDRYFSATEDALKYYGIWFGAYPYDHVTIVDPAYQSGSGGMEYPTLFTGGTRWLSPVETRSPESVTIHEYGHQIWYGVVANNEFEHAWIDEGFNSYSQARTMSEAYPPVVFTRRYFEGFIPVVFSDVTFHERFDGADAYYGFESTLKRDPMSMDSWKFGPGSYGLNSYNRPAMMLRTLEKYLGWETFQNILSTFFDRWKFNHPKPEDFFAIVNEITGEDMGWFFEQVFYTSNVFDYAVGRVVSDPVHEPQGYVESEGGLIFRRDEEIEEDEETDRLYRSSVFVRRWGEAVFPVEVQVTFDNGDVVLEQWDGKKRWSQFEYLKPARVDKVVVDPDHILILDFNYSNNSWVRESAAGVASTKWASKWMIWLQNLMEFFSFFS